MRPETIQSVVAQRKLDELQKKNVSLTKQLEQTVAALERQRRVKPTRFAPASKRARLKGDRIRLVLPDTHGSRACIPAIRAVLRDAKSLNPDEIILLGDHVDCGGFLAQHHTLGYVAESDYSYEEDIVATNAFLTGLQAAAPKASIDYLEGNHEARIEKWCVTEVLRNRRDAEFLRRTFAPEFLLNLKGRGIRYYRTSVCYDGVTVPGVIRRDKCYFFHGFSTAKNAVSATQSIVAGNCVFGHTHRAQSDVVRKVSTGEIGSWNPGCLCELQPLWLHGRPSEWTHGYAIQLISRTGRFLHLNIPIIDGNSLLHALTERSHVLAA